ncbi:MAG: response regulator [Candidatus Eisenbacteria bacterium]|uniref:Response regulator n=1 Tax=Eiseniibacteriota bacterium TaxID=2212470 RepID=A0A956SEM0_UNCEI|nr:response regulator [Candidatus Eisenbacteria bacterium]MCB9463109.1 response regulator [Candidatus Eisenbacteria bacterium]
MNGVKAQRILWADDEIDMLRPHILYLKGKGYEVQPVANGEDALQKADQERFDVVLLDEMMPGMGGLATLEALKEKFPHLPVIMITKSEEENLMNMALGRQIADYLTKPVNPSQIHLAIKKVFESESLQRSQRTRDYVAEFNRMLSVRHGELGWDGWVELYDKVVSWDLELGRIEEESLIQSHLDQKAQLNREFARFVEDHYSGWVTGKPEDRPALSVDVFPRWVKGHLANGERVAMVVVDCMRLDQWRVLEPLLAPYFEVDTEILCSILPTATPYSRNAIFAGLYPKAIAEKHPKYWLEDAPKEEGRNKYEKELMDLQLEQAGITDASHRYIKISTPNEGNQLRKKIGTLGEHRFLTMVFNFFDMLAHGRSESDLLEELAPDESALRDVLQGWFQHSSLFEVLKVLSRQRTRVIVTSDHGVVQCKRSSEVKGNRDTSTSIRYKFGDNLAVDPREALHVKKPGDYQLPGGSVIKHYLLAKENYYFVYPTNFHHYERHYKNSFQHGGISLEEMILPVATLTPRA